MSKFNKTSTTTPNSVNMAGGLSYKREDIRQEIATVVLNSMINGDSYYEKESDRLARIENLISDPDNAEFAAKAMVYTRNVGNLRSVSHYMASILSEKVKGSKYLRSALSKTFVRPDDLTETLALWNSRNNGKMVPNSLRRAFKDSLEKFDNYQLKKYESAGNKVKLRDVVKLAHPIPSGDRNFKALIEGTLGAIQTAQTVNAGSTGEERAENYKEMLQNRKLGYMAALKNLKNMLEAGIDDECVDMLCALLRNKNACLNSKVLPFRFTQAYSMVNSMSIDRIKAKKILKAVEDGFILSARNIPIVEEGESVAILLDESGSMEGYMRSEKSPFSIGKTLMASMLTGLDKDKTLGYLWATKCREVSINGSPMEFIKSTRSYGGGTDVWAPMNELIKTKTKVDKIVIFTDMQMYDINKWSRQGRQFKDMVKEYRKINPKAKVLFWNLEGYSGGTPMKLDHDILEVTGFSDKMLSIIPKMWQDKNALINEIEQITL